MDRLYLKCKYLQFQLNLIIFNRYLKRKFTVEIMGNNIIILSRHIQLYVLEF